MSGTILRSLLTKGLMLGVTVAAVFGLLWAQSQSMAPSESPVPSPEPMLVRSDEAPVKMAGAPAEKPVIAPAEPVQPAERTAPQVTRPAETPSSHASRLPKLTVRRDGSAAAKLDVNRATLEEFERLPGIGPGLAKLLLAHRTQHGPFLRVEDLRAVKGIGQKRFERLAPLVTVSARRAAGFAPEAGPDKTGSRPA